ncbi:hypothetical protein LC1981_0145 [Lacticaseibacillus paracasei NRIC 1981]|nr:hypothetical protein LC1981_0145 [Lacticaseibacillus paracasei NRIC 1981]
MLRHLALPVCKHANRGDHQRVRVTLGQACGDDAERLQRFTQAHLVAQQNSALRQRVAHAKRLPPEQVRRE